MSDDKKKFHETDLNTEAIVLWFDDLGSGNEEHRFLSNFYEGAPLTVTDLTYRGLIEACVDPSWLGGVLKTLKTTYGIEDPDAEIEFATGEHLFAAMKFWGTDWTHFIDIVRAKGPNPAKALGRSRQHPLRKDWEIVKLDVMAGILRTKFTLDREEGQRLLKTGDKMLVEGTFWHDDVWGVCLNVDGIPGRNWLGSLLMTRRAELRAMEKFPDNKYATYFGQATGLHNLAFGV